MVLVLYLRELRNKNQTALLVIWHSKTQIKKIGFLCNTKFYTTRTWTTQLLIAKLISSTIYPLWHDRIIIILNQTYIHQLLGAKVIKNEDALKKIKLQENTPSESLSMRQKASRNSATWFSVNVSAMLSLICETLIKIERNCFPGWRNYKEEWMVSMIKF